MQFKANLTSACTISLAALALAQSAAAHAATATTAAADDVQTESAADDADTSIVVTGIKQQYVGETPLQDLPQSVVQLDGELLANLNATRLDTALELASGVARQNNFGGLWDSFAIRGFAGDENFPSGFLVNGFNGGRGYGGPRDISNVERIDVLKGPNSALFGRGEPGGTINIVTKKPEFDTFGSFTSSAGRFDTYRVEGDFNLAITDGIAIRLTGAVEDADSFRDTVEARKYVANPSVLFKFSDSTLLTYEMEFVNQEVPFDRGVVAVNGVLGLIPNSRFLGNPNDGPIEVEVLGHQLQFQHDFSDDWTLLIGGGYKDTTFVGFSADPELVRGRQTLFVNGRTLARQRRFRDYDTTHAVIRAELSGTFNTGSIVHNLRIGGDWDRFDINTFQTRFRPTLANPYGIDIFNPVYTAAGPVPNAVIQNASEEQKAIGVYLQDQIDITDQLSIRLGGRYDDFQQDIANRINNTSPSRSYNRFSPNAGIVFKPVETLSLYASYSKGFRPNSGLTAANQPFDPEISTAYEVGAKFVTADGRVTSTLALYTMEKTNVLSADPLNAGFSLPIGSADSKGVEFDLNAKLPGDFEVFLAYAYTDAGWAEDVRDPNFGAAIRKGDPLINIPKHQANALLMKNFAIGDAEAMLGAGVTYVGRRLGETATTFFLPDYTIARVLGSVTLNENIKISANIDNLFNTRFYASSYAALWVQPGAPRTYAVRATFSF